MRDIKFRVWDPKGKRMRYLENADFIIEYSGPSVFKDHVTGERVPVDWKLMQYTGLTDKNGKNIYEGDIIEYEDRRGTLRKEEVIFNRGTFSAGHEWDDGEFDHYSIENLWYIDIEIIGNVWEGQEVA